MADAPVAGWQRDFLRGSGQCDFGALGSRKNREDPYYRENEYITREMFWSDFVFSRTFSVDADLLNEETVELVCEGLDTLTEIKINGKSVAKTSDMHRTYRFPVKKYLKQGENTIEICFFSVLKYIKNYEFRENREIHYVPCGAMEGNELVRKAHSMFGRMYIFIRNIRRMAV